MRHPLNRTLLSNMPLLPYLALLVFSVAWLGCGGSPPVGTPSASAPAGTDQATSPGANQGGSGAQAGSSNSKLIGVSVLTLDNPFFKVIGDNILKEAASHGYDVVLVSGENDVARQANQVKDFIVRGVQAIVLCPCDSLAIGPAIQEANQAGIPVFTTDIACQAEGVEVVSHIATDNLDGGRQAGLAMIEALGETGGEVVIIDYKEVESCKLRVQGFKETIDKHNVDHPQQQITVVAELPGKGAKDQGYKAAQDAVTAHPNMVGIFAINDPSALGVRAALEEAGLADKIKIIGFDGQPEGKEAIRLGKIYADPIQFPDVMGRETAQAILKHFRGEAVEPYILIPTQIYRQADAEAELGTP